MTSRISQSVDICIIGAGVIGLSIAAHLTQHHMNNVCVLDRFMVLGSGSSGRSAGGFRQQFSSPDKIKLARESNRFFSGFDKKFGKPLGLYRRGYLLLAQDRSECDRFREDVVLQQNLGLPVEYLDIAQLGKRFPYLDVDGLYGANLCCEDGFLDPHALLQAFYRQAIAGGIAVHLGVSVEGITPLNSAFSVHTSAGTIRCRQVVNAAGAWAAHLSAMIGDTYPLDVSKRQIFVSAPFKAIGETPLIIQNRDPFYFRKEGQCFILSLAEHDKISIEAYDAPPCEWTHVDCLAELASTRVPLFQDLQLARGWAGLRTETLDQKPLLGRSRFFPGFFLACGMSGHGITFSPAVGRLMAGLIMGEQDVETECLPFSPDRF